MPESETTKPPLWTSIWLLIILCMAWCVLFMFLSVTHAIPTRVLAYFGIAMFTGSWLFGYFQFKEKKKYSPPPELSAPPPYSQKHSQTANCRLCLRSLLDQWLLCNQTRPAPAPPVRCGHRHCLHHALSPNHPQTPAKAQRIEPPTTPPSQSPAPSLPATAHSLWSGSPCRRVATTQSHPHPAAT